MKKNISHIPQIDAVKALAIIGVLLTHQMNVPMLMRTYAQFHLNQTVIIFFILMGLTLTISVSKIKGNSLRDFYTYSYFKKRISRLILPFIFIFLLSLILGLIYHKPLYFGYFSLIGLMPFSGPGNYFFSIIIEFIICGPLIYYFYKKNPQVTLLVLYLLNFLFEIAAPHINIIAAHPYLYSAAIFRYLFAIGLGLYISDEYLTKKHINLFNKNNSLLLLLLPFSIFYLYLGRFSWQPLLFLNNDWGTHNLFAVPFIFFITCILLNIDYQKLNKDIFEIILQIGAASYHIYLVQMLYFGFGFGAKFIGPVPIIMSVNIIINIVIGTLFYYFENNLRNILRGRYSYAQT